MAFKIGSDTVIGDGGVLSNIVNLDAATVNSLISYLGAGELEVGFGLTHTLDNPNAFGTPDNDGFGSVRDISGDYAIFGVTSEDDAIGGEGSGKAYIFNIATGTLVHTLDNPNSGSFPTASPDRFGQAAAISGNYVIVGAPFNDFLSSSDSSGTVYIFNLTTGALVRTINNPNAYGGYSNDFFGSAIAASGNYAIIGAYGEASGKAYIFNIETGALVHVIDNPNVFNIADNSPGSADRSDLFGRHVDISGNYAIVGAEDDDDIATEQESEVTNPLGQDSGRAFIFNVTTGALVQTLNNPNAFRTTSLDGFGESVAISGNYAIVGAPGENGDNTLYIQQAGIAYIFNVTTGALVHTLNNPDPIFFGRFGFSVDISGNYAIVGAGSSSFDKAYIFNVTTGALVHTLNNPNAFGTTIGDGFGQSVAISDNYVIVGARGEDDVSASSSGKAYVYELTPILDVTALEAQGLQYLLDRPITYEQLMYLLA